MRGKLIKLATITALIGVIGMSLVACAKKDQKEEKTKVRLNEVVRSVFYSPMYVAINEGFFEEEGLEIDLATGHKEQIQPSHLHKYVKTLKILGFIIRLQ